MSKFYLAHNAGGRMIAGEQFEVTEIIAGTSIGVFEAKTPEQEKALDLVVANPASGVESISAGEYENARKKKAPSLISFKHSNVAGLQTSMRGVPAVVVEGSQADDLTGDKTLESVDAALSTVGAVEKAPQPEEAAAQPPTQE